MDRRRILATTGISLTTALGGFLKPPTPIVSPSAGTPTADDACCLAGQSLSTLLSDEPGECLTTDGRPSLVFENECNESITTTVDLSGGGELSETYTLAPSERIVEPDAFEIVADINGTVTIDGEVWRVQWPERSCCRKAIALTPDGPRIGWMKPLTRVPDMRHGSYPGSKTLIRVESEGKARTITVTVTDRCTDTTVAETYELNAGKAKMIDSELVSGGKFDITGGIEGGTSETYEYDEAWGGVNVTIQADGSISFRHFAM